MCVRVCDKLPNGHPHVLLHIAVI